MGARGFNINPAHTKCRRHMVYKGGKGKTRFLGLVLRANRRGQQRLGLLPLALANQLILKSTQGLAHSKRKRTEEKGGRK